MVVTHGLVCAEVQNIFYLHKKEGVIKFADFKMELLLSAWRSCLMIVD